MSEFLAEARVLVRPDTTAFRAQLQAQITAATTTPITVPVALQAIGGAGAAAASLAAATGAAGAAANTAATSIARLAEVQALENTQALKGAVILEALSVAELQAAGASDAATAAKKRQTVATGQLNAALLGLRTAVGSAAVIGLGALSLAAIAAGTAIRRMLVDTAAFERELNTFQAVTGATADEMARVSAAAIQLGADVRLPAVTAGDAAVAMAELARAGLSVQDSIAGAEGVLQLATAAQLDNAQAAIIAANALNSFGLAGDQAVRVADNFANAANAAQGSIADIGIAFRQASAAARQVGLSLEDTTSILALFARNGLSGSDAGTALRTALIRLVAPSDAAAKKIRELGINVRDAQGNVRPDVFAQFGQATEDLAPAARDAAAALIFGQDAFRAVSIGAREGADGLRIMQFEIDQTGTAAEVAAARTQGLSGAMGSLSSASQTLGVTLGKLSSGPLQNILRGTADTVVVIEAAIRKFEEFGGSIGGQQEGELFPGGRELDNVLKDLLTPGKSFSDVAKELRELIAPASEASKRLGPLNEELQLLQDARVEAERGGESQVANQLTTQIEGLRAEIAALKSAGEGIRGAVVTPLEKALETLEKVREIRVGQDVDTSGIDRLINRLRSQISLQEELELTTDRLLGTTAGLGNAMKNAAPKVETLARALRDLSRQSAAAQSELLKIQAEGGGPQQQIQVLQEDIRTQERIIAEAARRGGTGAAAAKDEARRRIIADRAEIESLQNELTAETKKVEDVAKKARDDQEAAFLRVLEAATRPLGRALDRAALTETLKDDIKFTTALIELYKRQIREAASRIRDAEARNRVLRDLEDKLFQATLERRKLQQENRERIRQALEERQERVQRGIQLDIELADLNENTRRGIALRLKLIAALKREAKVLKLQGNALKENRNERARIRQEIEDMLKEEKEAASQNFGAQLQFSILQQLQGFSANLLSNLIPAAATGGLLAGPQQPSVASQLPEGMREQAAVSQAANLGFSRGQGNETNSILRDILRQLENLNGRTIHPEATRQRKVQSGSMDTVAL